MNEQKTAKPIREVLRLPRFQKEISILLTAFAIFQAIVAVLLFVGGRSESENLFIVITALMQAIVYAVLAILIRFGSVSALVFAGILFAADTLLVLFGPSWEDARGVLIARGLLILVLVRFIKRERRANVTATQS